jgi:hypothetical protein
MISPQLASIIGPGNCPLIKITLFSYPSGAMTPRLTVKSYLRMTPVLGAWVYGLLPAAVSEPQGNPLGSGLFVRKWEKVGACKVPHNDRLNVQDQYLKRIGGDGLYMLNGESMEHEPVCLFLGQGRNDTQYGF